MITHYATETKREQLDRMRGQLELERSSFVSHWRELGEFIKPRRPRFTLSDRNKGDRRSQSIVDSTATLAARTLRSGMMSGITSPARPWFKLSVQDPALREDEQVKLWLAEVTKRMHDIFLRSNLYKSLPTLYDDMGTFATGAMLVEETFNGKTIHTTVVPVGSYMIATDDEGKVNTFIREFGMTVRQLVGKFGKKDGMGRLLMEEPDFWDNFSQQVKDHWTNGRKDTWVDVVHAIDPNPDFNPEKLASKYKAFRSCYYERGAQQGSINYAMPENNKFLRESGYDYFPVLAPRWETTGEDSWGTSCPGMEALGDVKQLQKGERRGMQAIEKSVNPPLVGPTALRTVKTSLLSGDVNYLDEREGQKGLRPVHEVKPNTRELEDKQAQVRARIRRAYYEDLFLMLATDPRSQPPTAREIEERHEEKLLALGPVLEQLNQDLLDPLIDITFDIMLRQRLIPPPPQALSGATLKVDYISVMAQAQKLVGLAGMERFMQFVGQLGSQTGDLSHLDVVDIDELIVEYADMLGVPPKVIRAIPQIKAIREARLQAQQAQARMAQIQAGATAARDLAAADMDGDNALTRAIKSAKAGTLAPAA